MGPNCGILVMIRLKRLPHKGKVSLAPMTQMTVFFVACGVVAGVSTALKADPITLPVLRLVTSPIKRQLKKGISCTDGLRCKR